MRLQGRVEFPLRVGDYRIIHAFDVSCNELLLVTLGHRLSPLTARAVFGFPPASRPVMILVPAWLIDDEP